jgi:REP element-mobilizing transposase RayT
MANTYTQLNIQFVFTVSGRQNLINDSFRIELEKVICGIVRNHKCKTLAVYCNPDHTHLLVGMHPDIAPSKLMEQVKSGTSKWINERNLIHKKFSWQKGFGAFTYSKSHLDNVIKYILNQPNHHKNKNFRDEYLESLKEADIEYDEKYLFQWVND